MRTLIGFVWSGMILLGGGKDAVVAIDFEHTPATAMVHNMERTVAATFRAADIRLKWIEFVSGRAEYPETALRIHFKGRCSEVESVEPRSLSGDRLPLGWTNLLDGEVQPYATIDCDAVARFVHFAYTSMRLSYALRLTAYYNLMARVVSHELVHMLLRSAAHQDSDLRMGLVRPQVVFESAQLTAADKAALRRPPRDAVIATSNAISRGVLGGGTQ